MKFEGHLQGRELDRVRRASTRVRRSGLLRGRRVPGPHHKSLQQRISPSLGARA